MPLTLSEKAMGVKPSSTLAITAKANEMKAKGVDLIGFGAGEPDFNTPDNINDAAIKAINSGFTKYTAASGIVELRRAIANKFKACNDIDYKPNQIVVSNGAKHSLTNVFQAILNPGDEVILPSPYWLTYPEIVRLCGGIPVYVVGTLENNYKVTAQQIKEAVTDKTKALILNSPNNPTGMVYSKDELLSIAEVAIEMDFYVISDEIYEYLVYGDTKHISIASLGDEIYKRTITCSGVSKSYSMTGWRIGYTGSSVEIAELMGGIQSHQTSNPCTIAQKAALEALVGPQESLHEMVKEFDKRREYMYQRISKVPLLNALEPDGAFYVFIDFGEVLKKSYDGMEIETTERVAEILLEDYEMAVVPCEDFGFPNFIRLSYAISMEDIEKGLDRLERFVAAL